MFDGTQTEVINMNKELLKLNLQHFGDGSDDPTEEPEHDDKDMDKGDDKKSGDDKPEKMLTQEEFESALKARLARERRKQEEEDERKKKEAEQARLEGEGKYKELLETYQTELAQMKAKEAERERHAEIVAILKGHGFDDKDADKHATRIGKYVSDDDDLESEIKDYASDFKAASTVDPSAGYGDKGSHKHKDDEDYGQDVLDRVKGLSRTKFGK